ncbi:MAG: glycoside hydrolase [Candidatus Brocadiaceae bacterium]|nr:glycoside hydrolase [Candidatus Brocadiaceae bacterium]
MKPTIDADLSLIRDCYDRSLQLLRKNSTPDGIIACAKSKKAVDRHYVSIFGRDAAICSLGMIVTKDRELIDHARNSLFFLAQHQASNGQIPKYVKPIIKEVDFWYSGCIDATLWWLIAVNSHDRFFPAEGISTKLREQIDRAINWLFCQEHQGLFLLQQNEASDWADIMPRSGFVLYSNALWFQTKKLYKISTADKTKQFFKTIFFPFDEGIPEHRRARIMTHYIKNKIKKSDFYLSFVNFSFWGEEVDVYGNILSALFGLLSVSEASQMVDRMLAIKVNHPYPVRVVHLPINEESRLWRPYMNRHKQNVPHKYHNGGIWPYVGGFWVILLSRLERKKLAWTELGRYAEANRVNNWSFNEWLHGKTGEPGGMGGQSWNAAMFLLAYHTLHDNIDLFSNFNIFRTYHNTEPCA